LVETIPGTADFLRRKNLCDERKFVSRRLHRLQISAVALLLLLPATSAVAARQANIHVTANCVGDTVSGGVSMRAKAGTPFTLRLLKRQTAASRWTQTKLLKKFTSRGGSRIYRFRFNVSAFDAYAYRLGVYRSRRLTQSAPIAAASCAPGLQVPEAPLALLLPLSLLATASLLVLRRRALL
jgi:hypothetical protein